MGKLKNFYKPISCKPCTDANDNFWGTAVKVANNSNYDSGAPNYTQRKQIRRILDDKKYNDTEQSSSKNINNKQSSSKNTVNNILIGSVVLFSVIITVSVLLKVNEQ